MRRIVGVVAVLLGLAPPAWAGIETGLAAYLRGDFATAEREYRQLAENDDPAAQFGLGLLYHFGEGVPRDHAEGARWYSQAAMQGEFRAQYYLGDMHRRGHGVTQDYTVAVWWYSAAADQGYAAAQYALGLMYRRGLGIARDDAETVRWFREAAGQEHVRAKAFLAHMFHIGHGVPQDFAEAARWYRAAAEQGDTKSRIRLARMLYHGDGMKRDHVEAAKWYRRLAEQGDLEAPFRLGVMYYVGEGVKRDYIRSHKWFDVAASRAKPGKVRSEPAKNRDIVARRMDPAQIAAARRLAREWQDKKHVAAAAPLPPTRQRVSRIQQGLASIGYGRADGIFGRQDPRGHTRVPGRRGLAVDRQGLHPLGSRAPIRDFAVTRRASPPVIDPMN